MNKATLLVLLAGLVGLISGCATAQLNSNVETGIDLPKMRRFYIVRLPNDQRGIDKLIAERLTAIGKEATAGDATLAPADAEAIITYQDKWMWDITMYMIELNVQVRYPRTEIAMATGHSMRTSLVRKSPEEMVNEVLTDLFKNR